MDNIKSKKMIKTAGVMITLCLVLLVSCNSKYGSLVRNVQLNEAYRNKQLIKDYEYYYIGRSRLPYAVIGIDKTYTLTGKGWIKIENQKDLYDKIDRLDDRSNHGFNVATHAYYADIKDNLNNGIGVWFSYYTHTIIEVDQEAKTVHMFNPYVPGGRYSDHESKAVLIRS